MIGDNQREVYLEDIHNYVHLPHEMHKASLSLGTKTFFGVSLKSESDVVNFAISNYAKLVKDFNSRRQPLTSYSVTGLIPLINSRSGECNNLDFTDDGPRPKKKSDRRLCIRISEESDSNLKFLRKMLHTKGDEIILIETSLINTFTQMLAYAEGYRIDYNRLLREN